jgi:hypothetical protein
MYNSISISKVKQYVGRAAPYKNLHLIENWYNTLIALQSQINQNLGVKLLKFLYRKSARPSFDKALLSESTLFRSV